MRSEKKAFLTGLLLAIAVSFGMQSNWGFAQASSSVVGEVIAKGTKTRLSGAIVALESPLLPSPLRDISDESGRFAFHRLSPGQYTLTVQLEGFSQETRAIRLAPRENQALVIELSLKPLEETIRVVAEGERLLDVEQTSTSTLLEDKAIVDLLPLARRTHLHEVVISTVPGALRGHDDLLHLRGYELALNNFINGVSFLDNPHQIFSAGLSPAIVRSANVITGGFSAEYGNRFGGVLDIVTKSGFDLTNRGSITLGLGSALRNNMAIEYGGHTDNWGYYIYTSGFESNRFLSPREPVALHDFGSGMKNFLQLEYKADDDNFLKLVLTANGSNFEMPNSFAEDALRRDVRQRTREQTAILTWDRIFSKNAMLATSIYQRWTSSKLLPSLDPASVQARATRGFLTAGLKSDYTRFFGSRHTLKTGLDLMLLRLREEFALDPTNYLRYTHERNLPHLHFTPVARAFRDRNTGGQISYYIQDKIRLFGNLTADLGIRYDQYSLATSSFHFSPRINLAYQIRSTGTLLLASYNRLFMPPPIEYLLLSSTSPARFIRELAGVELEPLQPIVSDQFEVGLKQLVSDKLLLKITTYFRRGDNPVHTVQFPETRLFPYANFDRERALGAEVSLELPEIKRLGLSGYFNYAASRVFFWGPVTGGFIGDLRELEHAGRFLAPMDQTHTGTAGVTYRNSRGFWASAWLEYGSGTPIETADEEDHHHGSASGAEQAREASRRVPQHLIASLSFGLDLLREKRNSVSLQFNIENITNSIYKIAQESIFTPGQYSIPRLFSGSIKFNF